MRLHKIIAPSRPQPVAFSALAAIVPTYAIETGKQPFAIARQDGQPMSFAGLWGGLSLAGRDDHLDLYHRHHDRQRGRCRTP